MLLAISITTNVLLLLNKYQIQVICALWLSFCILRQLELIKLIGYVDFRFRNAEDALINIPKFDRISKLWQYSFEIDLNEQAFGFIRQD